MIQGVKLSARSLSQKIQKKALNGHCLLFLRGETSIMSALVKNQRNKYVPLDLLGSTVPAANCSRVVFNVIAITLSNCLKLLTTYNAPPKSPSMPLTDATSIS